MNSNSLSILPISYDCSIFEMGFKADLLDGHTVRILVDLDISFSYVPSEYAIKIKNVSHSKLAIISRELDVSEEVVQNAYDTVCEVHELKEYPYVTVGHIINHIKNNQNGNN